MVAEEQLAAPMDESTPEAARQCQPTKLAPAPQPKRTTNKRYSVLLKTLTSLTCRSYRRHPLQHHRAKGIKKAKPITFNEDQEMLAYGFWSPAFDYDFASCIDAYLARISLVSLIVNWSHC